MTDRYTWPVVIELFLRRDMWWERSDVPGSRSVSAPSSVTNTSPCSNGFIVPASTFMYGSILTAVTLCDRARSSAPMLDVAMPFPREDTTPPVMKMYLVSTSHPLRGSMVALRPCVQERLRGTFPEIGRAHV